MKTFSIEEGKLICSLNAFADAMKERLLQKMAEGYTGWDDPSWTEKSMIEKLNKNVSDGDMVDVANVAMFLWCRK